MTIVPSRATGTPAASDIKIAIAGTATSAGTSRRYIKIAKTAKMMRTNAAVTPFDSAQGDAMESKGGSVLVCRYVRVTR